jgi:hypothetical protein
MVGGVARSGEASLERREASQRSGLDGNAYFVDRLFRSDHASAENDPSVRAEAGRIFAHILVQSEVSADST